MNNEFIDGIWFAVQHSFHNQMMKFIETELA